VDQQVIAQLEKAFKRGQYGRVVFTCDQLLQESPTPTQRAHILFWKGSARQRTGPAWEGEAISSFREGMACANRDRPVKVRLMAALSRVYALSGDCAACERLVREFDTLSRGIQPEVIRWGAFLLYNYGCTLDNAFRYADAVPAFQRAALLAAQAGLTSIEGASYHNLGGVYLALGNLRETLAAMTTADALWPDEEWGHKKLSRQAEYCLATGDLVGLQQYVTAALLHPQVDDMTRADVYYTWAQALAQLSRPAEAYEKALQALDYAVKDVHLPGIHKINRFLQQHAPRQPGR
jgi:tetratricopeptide (TPR) repeat protein